MSKRRRRKLEESRAPSDETLLTIWTNWDQIHALPAWVRHYPYWSSR